MRLADKQMNVFWHNDVSDDHEHIAPSHLLQHVEKQVTAARSPEQGLSAIATASDEMKIPGAVAAVKVLPHGERITPQEGSRGDGSHRQMVIKKSGGRALVAGEFKISSSGVVLSAIRTRRSMSLRPIFPAVKLQFRYPISLFLTRRSTCMLKLSECRSS